MSSHAFVVSYDIAGARLHGRKFIIPDNTSVPVLCYETAGEKYVTVLISAQRFYIRQEGDRFLLTLDRHDKGVLRFLQVPADHPRENGQQSQVVALRTPNGYACFHPDYSNHLDSPNLLDWELLALCPLGHPDPVRTAGVTNDNVRNVAGTVIEDYKELPAAKTKRS
ncbi:hypothetical protein GOB93_11340 [Acetobacter musti]|uniref:Uncharacterized protein n=1 Tax=Acetobacter musti TaxID=864732 RepID=A0ABX0JP52_9PROT|nr:hypothetical protein [Acetobacter musti]NHN85231.1 hypothetical protein [Acetobacter musti]